LKAIAVDGRPNFAGKRGDEMLCEKTIPVYPIGSLVPSTYRGSFSILRFEDSFPSAQGNVYAPHRHDLYEAFWITKGQGTLWVDSKAYALCPPMLHFVSPGQVHAWKLDSPGSGFVLYLGGSFFASNAENGCDPLELILLDILARGPIVSVPLERVAELTWFFHKLEEEFLCTTVDADAEAVLRAYFRLLLTAARRSTSSAATAQVEDKKSISQLTQRFIHLVEKNFRESSSVTEYAISLNVTPSHLTQAIKRATGKAPGQIIRERIILEAERLLQYSNLSTAEIAYQLEFDDPSYFSRFFKEHTGCSPSAFRSSFQTETSPAQIPAVEPSLIVR
jgi:AraC-like DNA-binding protein